MELMHNLHAVQRAMVEAQAREVGALACLSLENEYFLVYSKARLVLLNKFPECKALLSSLGLKESAQLNPKFFASRSQSVLLAKSSMVYANLPPSLSRMRSKVNCKWEYLDTQERLQAAAMLTCWAPSRMRKCGFGARLHTEKSSAQSVVEEQDIPASNGIVCEIAF
eukprot:2630390-Amphidinium_carterae.1